MKRHAIACLALWVGFSSLPALALDPQRNELAVQPLLGEIRLRQAELDRREREVAERERVQSELEALVEAQFQEISAQRQTLEHRIEAWGAIGDKRIKQLAKIYAAMKPTKAARLLEGLEANLATQVLSKMKYKKSAAILERIEAERALTVTRQVAHPLSFEPADLAAGDL